MLQKIWAPHDKLGAYITTVIHESKLSWVNNILMKLICTVNNKCITPLKFNVNCRLQEAWLGPEKKIGDCFLAGLITMYTT